MTPDDVDPVDHPELIDARHHALADGLVLIDEQAEALVGETLAIATLDWSAACFVQHLLASSRRHLAAIETAVSARLATLDGA